MRRVDQHKFYSRIYDWESTLAYPNAASLGYMMYPILNKEKLDPDTN